MSSMDNLPLSKAIARLGIKVIYISLGCGSYIDSRECCSFLCKYTFSLEVVTCAKGYSAHHLFPESLSVCLCMHIADRLMDLCFLPVISVPLKISRHSQPRKHP